MTDLLSEQDLKREAVKEPAKRWRNKMQAKERLEFRDFTYEAGDFFQAGDEYPSKDSAQSAAFDFLSCALDPPRDHQILSMVAEYIGAFPVDGSDT